MAGWTRYNEHTGELETGLYDRPFVVRARLNDEVLKTWNGYEETTIAAFRTEQEAKDWLEKNEAGYKQGPQGFGSLFIENWNE